MVERIADDVTGIAAAWAKIKREREEGIKEIERRNGVSQTPAIPAAEQEKPYSHSYCG